MDITKLKPTKQDEGVLVHFRDASGEPEYDVEGETKKPVTALVAGEYSERHKKATRKLTAKSLKRQDAVLDAEGIEERALEIQAACIITWDFTANGKPLPITPTNWAAILAVRPEYEKQISSAIYGYGSFFAQPSTDSSKA